MGGGHDHYPGDDGGRRHSNLSSDWFAAAPRGLLVPGGIGAGCLTVSETVLVEGRGM